MEWDNLDIAKENLQAIKEHYEMYRECDKARSWRGETRKEDVLEKYKDRWWFVNDEKFAIRTDDKWGYQVIDESKFVKLSDDKKLMVTDIIMAQNCMYLRADNGNLMRQWNPWCGYFDTLYGAEIVTDESDLKFTV